MRGIVQPLMEEQAEKAMEDLVQLQTRMAQTIITGLGPLLGVGGVADEHVARALGAGVVPQRRVQSCASPANGQQPESGSVLPHTLLL